MYGNSAVGNEVTPGIMKSIVDVNININTDLKSVGVLIRTCNKTIHWGKPSKSFESVDGLRETPRMEQLRLGTLR